MQKVHQKIWLHKFYGLDNRKMRYYYLNPSVVHICLMIIFFLIPFLLSKITFVLQGSSTQLSFSSCNLWNLLLEWTNHAFCVARLEEVFWWHLTKSKISQGQNIPHTLSSESVLRICSLNECFLVITTGLGFRNNLILHCCSWENWSLGKYQILGKIT